MKKLLTLALAALFVFGGCAKYDDAELRRELEEHGKRIAALEEWQKTVNTNISALQSLVAALETNDYVTGVTPVVEGGATVGYTVTFTKSPAITIRHGAKGDKGEQGDKGATGGAGNSPQIGVKQHTDGKYYWTLDGEWLLDAGGEKVPATGDKGDDGEPGGTGPGGSPGGAGAAGKTPKVAIGADGYWYVAADGDAATATPPGTGWTSTGVKATGEKGEQGDAIFAPGGVDNSNNDHVIFTLADGTTEITLPRYRKIGITLGGPTTSDVTAGDKIRFDVTSTGSEAPADIRAVNLPVGWTYIVESCEDNISQIYFSAPAVLTDENRKAEIHLLLVDKTGQVWMYGDVLMLTAVYANNYDPGVTVNGVVWATRNVNAPGTFAARPESAGMFYQWNRRLGWSATGPLVNSDGGTAWDNSIPDGDNGWTEENDPCPAGWHVPTVDEFEKLMDNGKVSSTWTVQGNEDGRLFTDIATGKSLFFPAFGYRTYEDGGLIPGATGYYWSAVATDDRGLEMALDELVTT